MAIADHATWKTAEIDAAKCLVAIEPPVLGRAGAGLQGRAPSRGLTVCRDLAWLPRVGMRRSIARLRKGEPFFPEKWVMRVSPAEIISLPASPREHWPATPAKTAVEKGIVVARLQEDRTVRNPTCGFELGRAFLRNRAASLNRNARAYGPTA